MSEKIKAVRGDKDRVDDIKAWLISQGANKDLGSFKYNSEDYIYHVTPDGYVRSAYMETTQYLFDIVKLPRWKAICNQHYFYINSECEVCVSSLNKTDFDNLRWDIGNYFKTREEAEKVCNKIRNLLKENE